MALGDNIKRMREEHSLTQQQLADKLYVSRQTVCRWENGSRCPDLIMVYPDNWISYIDRFSERSRAVDKSADVCSGTEMRLDR